MSLEVSQLAANGHMLYQFSEFSSWLYEPLDALGPYIDRYWSNRNIFENSGKGQRGRAHSSRKGSKERKSKVSLEEIITEALNALITDEWRLLYESRLRRQGMLFQFAGRKADAELVRGVAAALHPSSGIAPTDQPFLFAMMGLSIEQGPLRAMMEALEAGEFGPVPIDLFPDRE